jgi:hypothetical protein
LLAFLLSDSNQLTTMISDQALQGWIPASLGEARALVRAVLERAGALGVVLAPPPLEPDNCCGNDCVGCVWDGYYAELIYWRDEALLHWQP